MAKCGMIVQMYTNPQEPHSKALAESAAAHLATKTLMATSKLSKTDTKRIYYKMTDALKKFFQAASFKYTGNAELSRAAGINSSKTVANALKRGRCSGVTAKKLYKLAKAEGFPGDFTAAFNETT